jgi:branched-chain amino acid transport system substrate-binding protein
MREMRLLTMLAAALAVGVVAAGCGSSDNGNGNGSSDSKSPIKIGASLPLTGDFSEPGKAAQQGYQVWEKMVNDQGGVLGRKVQIVVRDDASDQNTVVADYNALISRQKVNLLLGTFSSLLNLPASTVAERNRMLYVEPAGGAPEIFSRGYKYLFFAQQATADHQGDLFAQYILSLPAEKRPKTAAYPTLDDPFAVPVLEGIRKKLEPAGIRTVYKKTYPADTQNFDAIANAVKAANPDLLVHGATFADGVGFIRALSKVGFDPKYFFETSAPSFAGQFSKGVGVKNTEGIFYAVSWTPEAKTPGNQDFLDGFKKLFGNETPAEDAADAFATAQVMQAAIKAVGSIDDQRKLADWLRSHTVDTILGPLKWNETGAPQGQFLIGQWQSGQSEIVLPKAAATSESIVERQAAASG